MQIHEQLHQLYSAPTSTMLANRFLARRFAAKSMEEQLFEGIIADLLRRPVLPHGQMRDHLLEAVAEPVLGRRDAQRAALVALEALGAAVRAPAGAGQRACLARLHSDAFAYCLGDTSSTRDRLLAAAWLSRLMGRGCLREP